MKIIKILIYLFLKSVFSLYERYHGPIIKKNKLFFLGYSISRVFGWISKYSFSIGNHLDWCSIVK